MSLLWIPYFANIQDEKWIREKGPRSQCLTNLNVLISFGTLCQSYEVEETGDRAFPKSLPLLKEVVVSEMNDLLDETCPGWTGDECPMSHAKYAYVPYDRPPNPESSTAANTPVLWDGIIGSHHAKYGALWGNGVPQTCIVFEDGHSSHEENFTCHGDIFKKYAPLMSQEDAETLRQICEGLDQSKNN